MQTPRTFPRTHQRPRSATTPESITRTEHTPTHSNTSMSVFSFFHLVHWSAGTKPHKSNVVGFAPLTLRVSQQQQRQQPQQKRIPPTELCEHRGDRKKLAKTRQEREGNPRNKRLQGTSAQQWHIQIILCRPPLSPLANLRNKAHRHQSVPAAAAAAA